MKQSLKQAMRNLSAVKTDPPGAFAIAEVFEHVRTAQALQRLAGILIAERGSALVVGDRGPGVLLAGAAGFGIGTQPLQRIGVIERGGFSNSALAATSSFGPPSPSWVIKPS